jgi:hypothetical protein
VLLLTPSRNHLQEYIKPYSCTTVFATGCTNSFSTKSEWVCHEATQHFQAPSWHCGWANNYHEGCLTPYIESDAFKLHLRLCHHVADDDMARRFQECQKNALRNPLCFWCGFCRQTIFTLSTTMTNREGRHGLWMERFDHIEDHFLGRHGQDARVIIDWLPE